ALNMPRATGSGKASVWTATRTSVHTAAPVHAACSSVPHHPAVAFSAKRVTSPLVSCCVVNRVEKGAAGHRCRGPQSLLDAESCATGEQQAKEATCNSGDADKKPILHRDTPSRIGM